MSKVEMVFSEDRHPEKWKAKLCHVPVTWKCFFVADVRQSFSSITVHEYSLPNSDLDNSKKSVPHVMNDFSKPVNPVSIERSFSHAKKVQGRMCKSINSKYNDKVDCQPFVNPIQVIKTSCRLEVIRKHKVNKDRDCQPDQVRTCKEVFSSYNIDPPSRRSVGFSLRSQTWRLVSIHPSWWFKKGSIGSSSSNSSRNDLCGTLLSFSSHNCCRGLKNRLLSNHKSYQKCFLLLKTSNMINFHNSLISNHKIKWFSRIWQQHMNHDVNWSNC